MQMKSLRLKNLILIGIALICLSLCGCSSEQQQSLVSSDDDARAETAEAEDLCADGAEHQWGDAAYQWINDHTACTASHTCDKCGVTQTETENAVLVTDDSGNSSLKVDFKDGGFSSQEEDSENLSDVGAAFVVSEGECSAGEQVTVTISVKDNPGIVAAGLELRYDRDKLELVKAEDKQLLADATFSKTVSDYPYILTWNDALASENTTENGELAVLTFKIKDGAAPGKASVSVGYSPGNVFDVDLNNVTFRTVAGSVTVR